MPPTMSFDERYRAVSARDSRFDGQFVTAVYTTGIYCRPSCPARTPKPANVTFFPTSAAAHEAGFRACKRCLPEASPGSPEWDLGSDTARRAMRLIAEGTVEREGVGGLAQRLGYSSRHLSRLLREQLGAGPLTLARAHRAHTARTLLAQTSLPVSEVAFAAGFASVRQFNDTIQTVFGVTPSALRATKHGGTATSAGLLSLLLPYRPPLASRELFSWFATRAIPGLEAATPDSYARTLRLPSGPATVSIADGGHARLRATLELTSLSDLPVVIAGIRRLADLDSDPVAVDQALSAHPQLHRSVQATPGLRVPGTMTADELLIRTMVGQQISVRAAQRQLSLLVEELGEPVSMGEGLSVLFPRMETIAEHVHEVVRGPSSRISAIARAAASIAEGQLQLSPGDDSAELRSRLQALPGVGPWTAGYLDTRLTGNPDVLLADDSSARAGARALSLPDNPRDLARWGQNLSPWRSYLTAHLWNSDPRHRLPALTERENHSCA